MDKKLFSISLMLIALALPAINIAEIPGMSILINIALLSISLTFVFLMILKWKWEKGDETEENKHIAHEKFMFMGLSILCVGVLFATQHWPGATFMRITGGAATFITALANIVLINEENCTYYSKIRPVAIAAIFFAAVGFSNYYWNFLFKTENSEYHHLVEIYDKNDTEEARTERSLELLKFECLDSKSYNHFDSLLTKANAMAEADGNARVLYLLTNYKDKYDITLEYVLFDKEYPYAPIGLGSFFAMHKDLFASDTKFFVVTDNAKDATSMLRSFSPDDKEIIIVE